MKILVLVKSVPKSDVRVSVTDGALNESDFGFELNPYDEYAIEAALKLMENEESILRKLLAAADEVQKVRVRHKIRVHKEDFLRGVDKCLGQHQ